MAGQFSEAATEDVEVPEDLKHGKFANVSFGAFYARCFMARGIKNKPLIDLHSDIVLPTI